MEDKKRILLLIVGYVIAIIVFTAGVLLTGCQTNRGCVNENILEYQRKITAAETRLRLYEQTIDDTYRELTSLGERAEVLEGTVDSVIELFGEYQQAVERLLCNYNALRRETESLDSPIYGSDNSSGD